MKKNHERGDTSQPGRTAVTPMQRPRLELVAQLRGHGADIDEQRAFDQKLFAAGLVDAEL